MNLLQKFLVKNSVRAILNVQAVLFRVKPLNGLGYSLNRFIARSTIRSKKISQARTLDELGKNWQKGFPSSKQVPITGMDERTVYGEIHTHCPLRGTGDLQACYKMMSYDREIAERSGGRFFVLRSQAEKGVHVCQVAIRFRDEDCSDIQQAHEK